MEAAIRTCSPDDLYIHTNSNPSSLPGLTAFSSTIATAVSDTLSRTFGYQYLLQSTEPYSSRLAVNEGGSNPDMIKFDVWVGNSSFKMVIFLPVRLWTHVVESFFGGSKAPSRNEARIDIPLLKGAYNFLSLEFQKNLINQMDVVTTQWFKERKINVFEGTSPSRYVINYEFGLNMGDQNCNFLISIPSAFVNNFWIQLSKTRNKIGTKAARNLFAPLDTDQELVATVNLPNVELRRIMDTSSGQMLVIGEMTNIFITLEYAGTAIGMGKLIERSGKYALQIGTI